MLGFYLYMLQTSQVLAIETVAVKSVAPPIFYEVLPGAISYCRGRNMSLKLMYVDKKQA